MTSPPTLRERSRIAVRAEMRSCGMELFAERGYEETTVADIARAAGASERTFFRYFRSKVELVLDSQAAAGVNLVEQLLARPPDEPVWESLRRAFDPLVETIDANRHGRSQRLVQLLEQTPELHRGRLEQLDAWALQLAPIVADRTGESVGEMGASVRAQAISTAAVGAYLAAQRHWLLGQARESMAALLDESMGAFRFAADRRHEA